MQFSEPTASLNSNAWNYSPDAFACQWLEQDQISPDDPSLSDSSTFWELFRSGTEVPQNPLPENGPAALQEREISILSRSQSVPINEIPPPYIPQVVFQFSVPSSPLLQAPTPFFPLVPPVTVQNSFVQKQESSSSKQLSSNQPVQLDISQMMNYSTSPLSPSFHSIQESEESMDDEDPISREQSQSDPSPLPRRKSPKRKYQSISKETKLTKQDIRREKNRLSAQASRLRQKMHIQELEREQSNTIALGQRVEEYVQHFRRAHPYTSLPSHSAFLSEFQSSSEDLSDQAEKVEIAQQRIEQVVEILIKEAIEAKNQKKLSMNRNILLEERIRQLELENGILRQQAAQANNKLSV